MEEKTPLLHKLCGFRYLDKYFSEKFILLKKNVISEGAVSHNVLYYQQLYIAHYQVGFYDNNCFE